MIIKKILTHRYALRECSAVITSNVQNVIFDMVGRTIRVKVCATVRPEDFVEAMKFRWSQFAVDMLMDDTVAIVLKPSGLKCVKHEFELTYESDSVAIHEYEFSYNDIVVYGGSD